MLRIMQRISTDQGADAVADDSDSVYQAIPPFISVIRQPLFVSAVLAPGFSQQVDQNRVDDTDIQVGAEGRDQVVGQRQFV